MAPWAGLRRGSPLVWGSFGVSGTSLRMRGRVDAVQGSVSVYEVLKPRIYAAMVDVATSARFIAGPEVAGLEEALAEYVGVRHCITCANGTDAMTIALRAWGVGRGDAVFVPDFTFFASGECPADEGATSVFVDVDERTHNLDAVCLEAAVRKVMAEGEHRARTVVAVDLFGQPADHAAIRAGPRGYGAQKTKPEGPRRNEPPESVGTVSGKICARANARRYQPQGDCGVIPLRASLPLFDPGAREEARPSDKMPHHADPPVHAWIDTEELGSVRMCSQLKLASVGSGSSYRKKVTSTKVTQLGRRVRGYLLAQVSFLPARVRRRGCGARFVRRLDENLPPLVQKSIPLSWISFCIPFSLLCEGRSSIVFQPLSFSIQLRNCSNIVSAADRLSTSELSAWAR